MRLGYSPRHQRRKSTMRLAKPLVLLTGCVVVYGASFLNPNRDNPRWASAEASAANLSELARSPTRPQILASQGQSARALWSDPTPSRPISPERLLPERHAAAPEIVAAPTPRSEPVMRSSNRRQAAAPSTRCGRSSCRETRRPVVEPMQAVVTEASDAAPAPVSADRISVGAKLPPWAWAGPRWGV